jgi:hypothetical protein
MRYFLMADDYGHEWEELSLEQFRELVENSNDLEPVVVDRVEPTAIYLIIAQYEC